MVVSSEAAFPVKVANTDERLTKKRSFYIPYSCNFRCKVFPIPSTSAVWVLFLSVMLAETNLTVFVVHEGSSPVELAPPTVRLDFPSPPATLLPAQPPVVC